MRRLATLVLAACFLGLGSGWLRFAHDSVHDCLHAAMEAAGATHADESQDESHRHGDGEHAHDEAACELRAVLNAALVLPQAAPPVVQAGPPLAFVTPRCQTVPGLRLPARIQCRGPPAAAA